MGRESIRARLARTVKAVHGPVRGKNDAEGGSLLAVETTVEGTTVENEFGSCLLVTKQFPSNFRNGTFLLSNAGLPDAVRFSLTEEFDGSRAVYLDTETTGLAGGTGTLAFLVGLGRFIGGEFVVRQYFMRDVPDETAMLEEVRGELEDCTVLVTYNGKSFDVPLLKTRFIMNGLGRDIESVPQMDILHMSRRLWKSRLGDCSLSNVERHILGVRREGDVPGSLIPEIYFEYLRSGDAGPLKPVFYHNCVDIVSLACLAGEVWRCVSCDPGDTARNHQDLISLGTYWAARKESDRQIDCFLRALETEMSVRERMLCLKHLSLAYKRNGKLDEATVIWREMAANSVSLYAREELAKHLEHHDKDYAAAAEMCREALDILRTRRHVPGWKKINGQWIHRQSRLLRRQERKELLNEKTD